MSEPFHSDFNSWSGVKFSTADLVLSVVAIAILATYGIDNDVGVIHSCRDTCVDLKKDTKRVGMRHCEMVSRGFETTGIE